LGASRPVIGALIVAVIALGVPMDAAVINCV
jgi:hypothetical protein